MQSVELAIRPWAAGDLPLLERMLGDPAMTEHLGGPETPEQLSRRHARYLRMNDADKGRVFVVVVGPEQVAAGSVGYWETDEQGRLAWEMGWSVLPEFQGQGLAVWGAKAVADEARKAGQHRFIYAFPSVDNPASNAVCRKAGFTLLGEMDSEYPAGNFMRVNNWRLDLLADASATPAT